MAEPPINGFAELVKEIQFISEQARTGKLQHNPFTPDEIERIKQAAHLVEWFETLGWIGKRLMGLVAALVLLMSQWERIVQFVGGGK